MQATILGLITLIMAGQVHAQSSEDERCELSDENIIQAESRFGAQASAFLARAEIAKVRNELVKLDRTHGGSIPIADGLRNSASNIVANFSTSSLTVGLDIQRPNHHTPTCVGLVVTGNFYSNYSVEIGGFRFLCYRGGTGMSSATGEFIILTTSMDSCTSYAASP